MTRAREACWRGRRGTWAARDVRLDTNAPGATESWSPQICCNEAVAYVVWHDNRNGHWDIYFTSSQP